MVAANADELEALRIKYLSKKGQISELFNDFRNVANEEKREVGLLLNELKNTAQDKINELKESFVNAEDTSNKIASDRKPKTNANRMEVMESIA